MLVDYRFNEAEDYEHILYVVDSKTLAPLFESVVLTERPGQNRLFRDKAWVDDRAIVVYSESAPDPILVVLDVRGGREWLRVPFVPSYAAISRDGRWIALAVSSVVEVYSLGRVNHQDRREAVLLRLVPQSFDSDLRDVAISKDGRVGAMIAGGHLSLWDFPSGRMIREIPLIEIPHSGISHQNIAFSEDAKHLLITGGGYRAIVDVTSGALVRNLSSSREGDLFGWILADDRGTVLCDQRRIKCTVESFVETFEEDSAAFSVQLESDEGVYRYIGHDVSLASDEGAVAVALGKGGVGWMELRSDGITRVIGLQDDVEVTSAVALAGSQVAVGLADGTVRLIDAIGGKTLRSMHMGGRTISDMVRVDDSRIALTFWTSKGRHQAALLSLPDMSVSELPDGALAQDVWPLAASGDGRWLVGSADWDSHGVVRWDTRDSEVDNFGDTGFVGSDRVEFHKNGNMLLVNSDERASLWDVSGGRIVRQFVKEHPFTPDAWLFEDDVIYVPHDSYSTLARWSTRTTEEKFEVLDWPVGRLFLGETRIATLADDVVRLLSVGEEVRLEQRFSQPKIADLVVADAADLILLNMASEGGVEVLRLSTGESIWQHVGLFTIAGVTADHRAVVLRLHDEDYDSYSGLKVLDLADGSTRFSLRDRYSYGRRVTVALPVINNGVVQGLLHFNESLEIELLSLDDGSVLHSGNLGISMPRFAVSDSTGDVFAIFDDQGRAVLWDTDSHEHSVIESRAAGLEAVSFSHDGRLLAIAEADSTVGLWDVSSGLVGVRRLAKLMAFVDDGWAIVAADGRYDASDPADMEGLNWVMADAPTIAVPLSVFYRDYYEPGLLARLLAGEEFPPIKSIPDLDRVQPEVEFIGVEPTGNGYASVTVEVRRSGANGVGDLKIFRDGRLVGLKENLGESAQSVADTWRVTVPDVALRTSGADSVEFAAYVFNTDRVKSNTHRFRFEDVPEFEARSLSDWPHGGRRRRAGVLGAAE